VLLGKLTIPEIVDVEAMDELCLVGELDAVALEVWVLLVELKLPDDVDVELTVPENVKVETVEELWDVDGKGWENNPGVVVWVLGVKRGLSENFKVDFGLMLAVELLLSENVEVETVEELWDVDGEGQEGNPGVVVWVLGVERGLLENFKVDSGLMLAVELGLSENVKVETVEELCGVDGVDEKGSPIAV